MPTLNLVTELSVDDLVNVVAKLDDDELALFEAHFEQLWAARFAPIDEQAAQIAEAHRLPSEQQQRLRALLEKNREEGLPEQEAAELDEYITVLDRRLEVTAEELLQLAEQRQPYTTGDTR